MDPWSQSAPGHRCQASLAAAPLRTNSTLGFLGRCCPVSVKRNATSSLKCVGLGTCYYLMCCSYINTAFQGLFYYPSWCERITQLKQRSGSLWVHLSLGGCVVITGFEKGWVQEQVLRNITQANWESWRVLCKCCITESFSNWQAAWGWCKVLVALKNLRYDNQTLVYFLVKLLFFPLNSLLTYLHFCLIGFFCVQAETLSWTGSPGATRPLLRWCLTDGCHQERLHSYTWVIHLALWRRGGR